MSIEYVDTLSSNLSVEIQQAFAKMQEKEKAKIDSCLAGMKGVSSSLQAVIDYGLEQLRASAIKPRVSPWVDAFLTVNHRVNEVRFSK